MCHQYQDNRYPILWIFHMFMVISMFIGCIKLKYAICKKFIGFLLIIYHSFWLVGDVMCYTPVINSTIALFIGMYITLLITVGIFDGLLSYCKCWGHEDTGIDKLLRQIEKEEKEEK